MARPTLSLTLPTFGSTVPANRVASAVGSRARGRRRGCRSCVAHRSRRDGRTPRPLSVRRFSLPTRCAVARAVVDDRRDRGRDSPGAHVDEDPHRSPAPGAALGEDARDDRSALAGSRRDRSGDGLATRGVRRVGYRLVTARATAHRHPRGLPGTVGRRRRRRFVRRASRSRTSGASPSHSKTGCRSGSRARRIGAISTDSSPWATAGSRPPTPTSSRSPTTRRSCATRGCAPGRDGAVQIQGDLDVVAGANGRPDISASLAAGVPQLLDAGATTVNVVLPLFVGRLERVPAFLDELMTCWGRLTGDGGDLRSDLSRRTQVPGPPMVARIHRPRGRSSAG